jgi:hypothetical protein
VDGQHQIWDPPSPQPTLCYGHGQVFESSSSLYAGPAWSPASTGGQGGPYPRGLATNLQQAHG